MSLCALVSASPSRTPSRHARRAAPSDVTRRTPWPFPSLSLFFHLFFSVSFRSCIYRLFLRLIRDSFFLDDTLRPNIVHDVQAICLCNPNKEGRACIACILCTISDTRDCNSPKEIVEALSAAQPSPVCFLPVFFFLPLPTCAVNQRRIRSSPRRTPQETGTPGRHSARVNVQCCRAAARLGFLARTQRPFLAIAVSTAIGAGESQRAKARRTQAQSLVLFNDSLLSWKFPGRKGREAQGAVPLARRHYGGSFAGLLGPIVCNIQVMHLLCFSRSHTHASSVVHNKECFACGLLDCIQSLLTRPVQKHVCSAGLCDDQTTQLVGNKLIDGCCKFVAARSTASAQRPVFFVARL